MKILPWHAAVAFVALVFGAAIIASLIQFIGFLRRRAAGPRLPANPTIVKETVLTGFDPLGEPDIRQMDDGSMYVVFNFMPPSWAEDNPDPFDDFDKQLSEAIGLPVVWEDRKVFWIEAPTNETVDRIRRFLKTYRTSMTDAPG